MKSHCNTISYFLPNFTIVEDQPWLGWLEEAAQLCDYIHPCFLLNFLSCSLKLCMFPILSLVVPAKLGIVRHNFGYGRQQYFPSRSSRRDGRQSRRDVAGCHFRFRYDAQRHHYFGRRLNHTHYQRRGSLRSRTTRHELAARLVAGHTHVNTQTLSHTHPHTRVRTHVYAHTCTHTRTHTNTHKHTQTHTDTLKH